MKSFQSLIMKGNKILFVLALLLASSHLGYGAKILFFLSLGSYSHRVAVQPWIEKLAETGHQVSIFSSAKPETPNPLVEEVLPGFFERIKIKNFGGALTEFVIEKRLNDKHYSPVMSTSNIFQLFLSDQRDVVLNDEFREWIKSAKYDLVIYTPTGKEIAVALAYRMEAKVISFMPASLQWLHDMEFWGLPVESSAIPDYTEGYGYSYIPDHFVSAVSRLAGYFNYQWRYTPALDALVKELFPEENIPPLGQLLRDNVSMVLLNEHYSTGYPRALPPFVVHVGGMHPRDSKGILAKNVEDFVSTRERFVFVSFGSVIKVSELPVDKQKLLFRTIESFHKSTNFLWKWEGSIPEGLPSNVLPLNWFPQQDVLAHPKCKGFITQGGQMSVQQAVYHGVPMIVIPVWGDQPFNAKALQGRNAAVHLELSEITEETFTQALNEILNNSTYVTGIKEVSRRFKDRPLSPVDTAVYWTEYVLRHDATHLKSPALYQPWWRKRLLDFYLGVLLLAILFIGLRIYLGKILIRFVVSLFKKLKAKLKRE